MEIAFVHAPALVEVEVIVRTWNDDIPLEEDEIERRRIYRPQIQGEPLRGLMREQVSSGVETLKPRLVNAQPCETLRQGLLPCACVPQDHSAKKLDQALGNLRFRVHLEEERLDVEQRFKQQIALRYRKTGVCTS